MVSEELVVQLSPEFPVPRQKIKIAIIDDNRDHLDSLATAFRRQGYEILTADTIRAGRELVERSKPQLVIMDVHLCDGDGLGLCQLLSDQVSTSDIPIIVLSGSEDPDIVRRARSAGCQYFLRKPFDPNALLLLAENTLTDRME